MVCACAIVLFACGSDDPVDATDTGGGGEDATMEDTSGEDTVGDTSSDVVDDTEPPPPELDVDAATRGFELYYRERVDRMLVQYNRFALFGHVGFGSNIRGVDVAKTGDTYEVIPGPTDNNLIGTTMWSMADAYRVFRSREIELTLIRMFDGLVYFEAVTGYPGVTSREVYPGWTRTVDGTDGTYSLTRFGDAIESPLVADPDFEAEVMTTFFDDVTIVYRENPAEFYFSHLPVRRLEDYSVTHSFSELPEYLRGSDCCSSLMRTPDEFEWGGAFWGNHNSRDNFPDLSLGFLAAMAVAQDEGASEDVREAAERALVAGRRIGDLMQENQGSLMTFDEHNAYGVHVIGGAVRPHGEPENENLGSMSACQMAYLSRAISSAGLAFPLPEVPLPGSSEQALVDELGGLLDCEVPEGVRTCNGIGEAYCGLDWSQFDELTLAGTSLMEIVRTQEATTPGSAATLIGSFQNDYDDMVEAAVAVTLYAELIGDEALYAEAAASVAEMTVVMREFGDLVYAAERPEQQARQRFEAAMFDALAGGEYIVEDFANLELEEQRNRQMESFGEMEDTSPWALVTDEEILERVEAKVTREEDRPWGNVVERYRTAYGEEPPVRRAGDGYEARGNPLEEHPWQAVPNPTHRGMSNTEFLSGVSLCFHARDVVDCTWAALGCAAADADEDGDVDADDISAVEGGLDIDGSGEFDELDVAFVSAAEGCWYE